MSEIPNQYADMDLRNKAVVYALGERDRADVKYNIYSLVHDAEEIYKFLRNGLEEKK
jgi:hypothetical protein